MAATPERSRASLPEPVDDEADQLRALLSTLLSGSYPEDLYLWDVASLCRAKPAFARQLLTLVDRYERLGQMSATQHRRIRQKIEESLAATASVNGAPTAPEQGPASTITAEVPVANAAPPAAPRRRSLPLEPPGPLVTAPLPAAPVAPVMHGASRRGAEPAASPLPRAAMPPAPPAAPRSPASAAPAPEATPPPAASTPAAGTPRASEAPPRTSEAPPAASEPPPRVSEPPPDGERSTELLGSMDELIATLQPGGESGVIGPGTVLRQRYELLGLLGFGGMASVFKAIDRYRARLGLDDCCVALKIIAPQPPNPSQVAALGREFHNAQQLSHPNIINVYEIDHEGEASFYTMELLEGEQLNQLLERIGGVLPRKQALAVIRDIGRAIAHAHSRGIVHADLKPQNIFVTYGGQVRVLDFGGLSVSGPVPAPPAEGGPWIEELRPGVPSAYRTATPAYASCQQLEGHRADIRDDVYALGCIAYELLSGRHPFEGRSATQARAQQLRPRRPAALRAGAWRALRSALCWERAQRPGSVNDWLAQLGVQEAVEQLPPSHQLHAAPPARVWGRRVAAALLLFVLIAAAAALMGQPGHLDWHQPDWQQALRNAGSTLRSARDQLSSSLGGTSSVRETPVSPPPPAAQAAAPSPAPALASAPPAAVTHRHRPSTADTAIAPDPDSADAASAAGAAGADAGTVAPDAAAAAGSAAGTNPAAGLTFTASRYDVADDAPAARLIVRRTGSYHGDLRFVWWTQEDTAKADVDYAPLGRRVERIPRGADAVAIYVPIISNPLRHRSESFYVALGAPGDLQADNPEARAMVTIQQGG